MLTGEMILAAYAHGLFPMADSRDAGAEAVGWYFPERRGVLPVRGLHVPRSLARMVRKSFFDVTFDRDFLGVMEGCAEKTRTRPDTWINADIIRVFCDLHRAGHAHSVECWRDGKLAGGIYGLSIGGAFFGESMFSRKSGASGVALVHLAAHLWNRGFLLFDAQYVNLHLQQFGIEEIPAGEYLARLDRALYCGSSFGSAPSTSAESLALALSFLQSRTQTS